MPSGHELHFNTESEAKRQQGCEDVDIESPLQEKAAAGLLFEAQGEPHSKGLDVYFGEAVAEPGLPAFGESIHLESAVDDGGIGRAKRSVRCSGAGFAVR